MDAALIGLVLAEDVHAGQDLPTTSTTNVDGYAVMSSRHIQGSYPVLTSQTYARAAGGGILDKSLPEGYIYRINTGGPLPPGANAVIMVEDTELVSTTPDGEEKEVRLLTSVEPGENVRNPGSDARKGDLILAHGSKITGVGGELGSLAFIGRKEVRDKL